MGRYCSGCGHPIDIAHRYCGSCGTSAHPDNVSPPTTARAQTSSAGTNGLAVASFVLGFTTLCGAGSILAIIFGKKALDEIEQSGEGGRRFALAGIVLGVVGLVVLVLYAFVAVTTSGS